MNTMPKSSTAMEKEPLQWPEKTLGGCLLALLLQLGMVIGAWIINQVLHLNFLLSLLLLGIPVGLWGFRYRARAKAQRERTRAALKPVAIGKAVCTTPQTFDVPEQVLIVLTQTSFALYTVPVLHQKFSIPLDAIVDVGSPGYDTLAVAFHEEGEVYTGEFENLEDKSAREWADAIAGARRRYAKEAIESDRAP